MAYVPFVPLRVFSAYTMLEGAIEPKAIGKYARNLAFPAVAITDRNGLYGVHAFQQAAMDEGVQPIIGAMLAVARPGAGGATVAATDPPLIDWLCLYAQDGDGYANLCQLVSCAHLDRPLDHEAHVSFEALAGHHEGLICLTAGAEGALARLLAQGQDHAADSYLDRLETLFPGRLYIELCRRGDAIEVAAEEALLERAYARNLPLVATNPTCFAEPEFHEAHDTLLCIADGAFLEDVSRVRRSCPEAWLKTGRQLDALFADLPEAMANTLVVAQRCTALAPSRAPILPSLAGDHAAEAGQLRRDAEAGLEFRLSRHADIDLATRATYRQRLDYEVDVIVGMGFSGYFLIVADFIKWAKSRGIPVGPGRGSGAGSVVAWALTITDLDPIQLGLLFERFLNPERVSMPDFDIDFCETRRGEVIRYVQQKYGRDHVAQIITFGKLKARAVLRDTGRVLQMSYGQVDRLCKLVPNHPTDPWDLQRAVAGVAELRHEVQRDPAVARLFELARRLEGLPRHISTHAAGVVIGDRPLAELVPMYRDPRSDIPVTQFDMKYVEQAGLVKFDFLGLKTLSVLQKAVELLDTRGIAVDLDALPLDDPAVFALLQRGETVGVFQLESEGMRRTLAAVKPTGFGDIIALVSLYRPGPMDNIPMFGRRKNGQEAIVWPHPLLAPVLDETYGIFVYQEQVMQAAQVLAGYSLGEADLLRRAMGKKKQEEMDAQRSRFVAGCADQAISASQANELFDLIDKFAGYGFNKSHAAAYALLAYQTAWLKTHYPHEFFAASMRFDMNQAEKLSIFVDDMRRTGVNCLPPSIVISRADFSVEQNSDGLAVRYALAGLKNVGERAMELLVEERDRNGPFHSLDDFADRIDPTLINRRSLETLAGAGAFDPLEPDRARIFAGAEQMLGAAQAARTARESGQAALFGGTGDDHALTSVHLAPVAPWTLGEAMLHERDAFGFYFSAHPVTQFAAAVQSNGAVSHADILLSDRIADGVRKPAVMAALVENIRWRDGRRGKRFIAADLSDSSGQFTASCFDETACEALAAIAGKGGCALLNVELDMRAEDETPRIAIRKAQPIEEVQRVTRLAMELTVSSVDAVAEIAGMFVPHEGGRCELVIRAPAHDGSFARVHLGAGFTFEVDVADRLRRHDCISDIVIQPLRSQAPKPQLRLVG